MHALPPGANKEVTNVTVASVRKASSHKGLWVAFPLDGCWCAGTHAGQWWTVVWRYSLESRGSEKTTSLGVVKAPLPE